MNVKKQSPAFYEEYNDRKEYYLKNSHGNIVVVNKIIVMERMGFVFKRRKDTATEDNVGRWSKVLPAEEDFSVVDKEDWEEMEAQRTEGFIPTPPEKSDKIKMGPDEGKVIKKAEADAKAKADLIIKKAEADAKAKAEEIIKKAEADVKAKADKLKAEADAKAAADAAKGNR